MEMVMFEAWVRNVAEGIENKMPSLRDLFAMSALQGMLGTDFGRTAENECIAASAYAIADEMLKARNRK